MTTVGQMAGEAPMPRVRAWEIGAVLFLTLVLGLELLHAIGADGLTNDEVLYIPAGYRQLMASDYSINPTAPPLAPMLAALGLLGTRIHLPEVRPGEPEIVWSFRFLQEANDAATVIARARLPVAVLTAALCLLAWVWARESHGPGAGLLALVLSVFHPSLLAHGHLATTDLPAAFLMLLGSWGFWRWSKAPGVGPALLVGASIGLAAATRLTGWLLLLSLVLVAAIEGLRPEASVRRRRALGVLIVTVLLIVPGVIWTAYGLHYAPTPGQSVAQPPAARLSVPGQIVTLALRLHALPEAYLEGIRYQLEHLREGHTAYLLGAHSKSRWWAYFPVAFLVKNTPGFLLAVAWTVAIALRARASGATAFWSDALPWIVPAAVIFVFASASGIQIGERYILPMYPFLILLVASTLRPLLGSTPARWLLAGLLLAHAGPTLMAASRGYLTYFNLLAGGPLGAHRVLLDSNLDWGQDLPRLAAWMRARDVGSVGLAYHGADNPDRFGIRHEDLPGSHLYPERHAPGGSGGFVAISPNLLFGLVPRVGDRYAGLRNRPPDDRAGVFFIFRLDRVPPAPSTLPPLRAE